MRVVSETSEAELARKRKADETRRAMDRVQSAVVDLTANLLRVTRGAGKSYELGAQANQFVETLIAYREVAGCYPDTYSLDNALRFERDEEFLNRLKGDALDEYYAKEKVLRGALQTVASRLLGQSTIQRMGENEMFEGIRRIEDIQEKNRKLHEVEWKRTPPRKKSRKPRDISM
jgi:hypothetical protein